MVVGVITAVELASRRRDGTAPAVLDVRDAWELALARLPDVLHVPMNEIPARLSELDASAPLVILCRSGVRSLQVARYLEAQGFAELYNLEGGILAWAESVDPGVARY